MVIFAELFWIKFKKNCNKKNLGKIKLKYQKIFVKLKLKFDTFPNILLRKKI